MKGDYIPRSKIEEKIEELRKDMLNENDSLELFYQRKFCYEVLQKLLESED